MNKITCECGSTVAKAGIYRHRKTMKHLKLITLLKSMVRELLEVESGLNFAESG